jgi:hypothetical protein
MDERLENSKPGSEREKVERWRTMFERAWNADEHNRIDALDDLRFRSGEQWDPLDKMERLEARRPVVTINQSPKFIAQVTGDLRVNKPSITVTPDGGGSSQESADLINGILRNIQRRAEGGEPYLGAVDDAATCGIGHFRITTGYLPDSPFAQDISIEPIENPLAVVWDPAARRPDRADARFAFVLTAMEKVDVARDFPDADLSSFDSMDYDPELWAPMRDTVTVAEVFEVVEVETTFALLEGERVVDLERLPATLRIIGTVDQPVAIVDAARNTLRILELKKAKTRRVKWARMTATAILEEGEWVTGHIPIVPVTGPETHFENRVVRESLLRWAKDPMRLYNFQRSAQTEMIGNMPKAPWLVTLDQVEGLEDEWSTANSGRKGYQLYNHVKDQPPPQRQSPPMTPPGLSTEIMLAQEDIKNTTGVYDAALGAQSNETSGKAILARQAESDVSLSIFGARLRLALIRAGEIIVAAIPRVYDTTRAMRIVHQDDTDERIEVNSVQADPELGGWRIVNDLTSGRHDVAVDIGPSYATQQEKALDMLTTLLADNPQAKFMLLDILVKWANIPGKDELVKRIRKMHPPGMVEGDDEDAAQQDPARQAAAEAAMQAQQVEMRLKEAETRKTEAEAEDATAEAMLTKVEAAERLGGLPPGAAEIMRAIMSAPAGASPGPSPSTGAALGQSGASLPTG